MGKLFFCGIMYFFRLSISVYLMGICDFIVLVLKWKYSYIKNNIINFIFFLLDENEKCKSNRGDNKYYISCCKKI